MLVMLMAWYIYCNVMSAVCLSLETAPRSAIRQSRWGGHGRLMCVYIYASTANVPRCSTILCGQYKNEQKKRAVRKNKLMVFLDLTHAYIFTAWTVICASKWCGNENSTITSTHTCAKFVLFVVFVVYFLNVFISCGEIRLYIVVGIMHFVRFDGLGDGRWVLNWIISCERSTTTFMNT